MAEWREEIIGNARLILADCMDVLPTLPKVDACITDPPYGLGERLTNGGGKRFKKHNRTKKELLTNQSSSNNI